jgi:Protein of unknown function (DUF2794)
MSLVPGDTDPSEFKGGEPRSLAPQGHVSSHHVSSHQVNSHVNSHVSSHQTSSPNVTFSRRELDRILRLYGRKVAAGEWRDYAIDFLRDRAVFSVFRRTSEVPIYRIEKNPKLARRQGAYSIISATGLIVRRGHELDRVLGVLDRSLQVVV